MLIKREVLEKVGLLPEEYFFGVEEWDYSYSPATRIQTLLRARVRRLSYGRWQPLEL